MRIKLCYQRSWLTFRSAATAAKYFFAVLCVVLFSVGSGYSQNVLDKAGLAVSPGATGQAYSLRVLSSAYTGPLVNIRIGSLYYTVYPDASTEKTFSLSSPISAGSASNTLNMASTAATLSSVVTAGVTNANLSIWYDQTNNSGSGRTSYERESAAGSGPQILANGAVITELGRPTLLYLNNGGLSSVTNVNSSYGTGSLVGKRLRGSDAFADYNNNHDDGWALGYGGASLAPSPVGKGNMFLTEYLNSKQVDITNTSLRINEPSDLLNNLHVYSGEPNGITTTNSGNYWIGVVQGTVANTKPTGGVLSEMIVFSSVISTANRNLLEQNQLVYYNIGPVASVAAGGCSGLPFNYDITASLTSDLSAKVTSYSWARPTVANVTSTLATSGSTGTISGGSFINTTGAAIVVPITITITVAGQVSALSPSIAGSVFTQVLSVTVNSSAKVNAQVIAATCSGGSFAFTPSGTIPSGTLYSWNAPATASGSFSGGASGTNQTMIQGALMNVTATAAGALYTISATTTTGCTSTFTSTLQINPKPIISGQIIPASCSGSGFAFTPTGTIPSGTNYSWNAPATSSGTFSGGSAGVSQSLLTGVLANITNTQATALYTVTATTSAACTSSFTATEAINPLALVNTAAITASCSGSAFVFTPTGTIPAATTYSWTAPTVLSGSLSGGNAATAQNNITGTLTNITTTSATASYSITATTGAGCISSFSKTAVVNPLAALNAFALTPTCSGASFYFTPTGSIPAATTYSWNAPGALSGSFLGGSAASGQNNISGILTSNTTTTATALYTITATTGVGCTSSFTGTKTIYPSAAINSFVITATCSGNAFAFVPTGIIPAGTTYSWDIPTALSGSFTGGEGVSDQPNVFGTLTNATASSSTALYTITSVSDIGCTRTFTSTITIAAIISNNTINTTSSTICSGLTPTAFTGGVLTGGSGGYVYLWESSTDGNNFSTASGISNAATYAPPALTHDTWYRRTVSSSNCSVSISDPFKISINGQPLSVGTQPVVSQTICNNTTGSLSALGAGASLNYNYQWYSNTSVSNNGGSLIGGGTLATYTVPATSTAGDRFYYVNITDIACGLNISSTAATVTTRSALAVNTQPAASQSICNNTGTSLSTAGTGGSGSYTYQWYSNTSNSNTGGTLITGATSATYAVPSIAAAGTKYFYAVITDATCGNTIATGVASVLVRAAISVGSQPVSSQLIPNNTTANISTAGAGASGTFTYQWYSNSSNSNTGGAIIGGATSLTYTVPATTSGGTRFFYAVISDATCSVSIATNVASLGTANVFVIGTQPSALETVCNNTGTSLTVVPNGGSSVFSYQWYSNLVSNNTTGTLINGATSASYSVPATLTAGNRYFYVIVTDVNFANSLTSTVGKITTRAGTPVTFSVQPVANTTICNTGSVTLQVTGTGGSSGTYTYQWYSNTSASNTGGVAINGETSGSITKQLTPAGNYYFYATAADPVCQINVPSSVAAVHVNASPTVALSSATQAICQNSASLGITATVSGGTGTTTYQWYSNATSSNTGGASLGAGNGAQTATYTPASAAVGTTYYYAIATLAGNGCASASSNTHETIVKHVAQPGDIVTTPSNLILCAGLPGTLQASLSNSSTITGATFTWYTDANLTSQAFAGSLFTTPVLNATTTYYVKVNGTNSCENIAGNGKAVTVTVTGGSQAPVMDQPANLVSCAGVNTSAVVFTGTITSAVYTWLSDNTSTGMAANGTGNIASFNGVNTSLANNVATISVSPFANGCTGLAKTFTIIIKPSFTVADAALTTCSNIAVSYTADNVPAGTKYSWTALTIPAGITGAVSNGAFQTAFTQTLVNTTNAPLQVIYSITADGCSSRSFTMIVTVYPVPQLSNQSLASAICSGAGFSFIPSAGIIPSGTLYTWGAPAYSPAVSVTGGTARGVMSMSISENILSNSLATVANANYTVTPYNPASMGSCVGQPFTLTVPVNPKPVLNVTTAGTVCNNSVASFVPSSATAGVSFAWRRETAVNISTAAASGTNGFSERINNTAAFPVLVNYIYMLTANGCSNEQNVQLVVNPDPVLNSATAVNICSGSIFNYNPSSLTNGTSFAWSRAVVSGIRNAANAGNNDVFEALVNTTILPVVVTYHFTLGFGGCQHTEDVLVTVNPIPAVLDAADQVVCNGAVAQASFSGSSIPNTVYNWTNNNSSIGLSSSGQGNISFTTVNQQNLTQSGIVTVVPVANGCSGLAKSFTILVNPTPTLSSTLTPSSVCGNAPFIYIPQSNTPGTAFAWTRAKVAGIENGAGSGTGTINEILRNSSNGAIQDSYVYTLSANGCTSTRTVNVAVSPIPVVTNPGDQVVCSNSLSIINFSGSIVNNTTYSWANDNPALGLSGSGIGDLFFNAVNAGTAPVSGSIKVTPEASGCKGNPESFLVTINPTLTLKSTLSPAAICSNSNFYYLPLVADTSAQSSVTWSRPAVYGLSNKPSFGSKEINDTLINATGSPILVTYNFTLKNKYCSNTQNVVVQVNPSITITNVQSGINVCSSDPFVFSPVSGATGIQYNWSRAAVTGIANTASAGTGDINEVLSNTTDVAIDAIYKYTLSIGSSCNSEQLLKVTVKPSPKLVSSTNFVNCSNALLSYVPVSNLQGTSFTWSRAIASGIANSASYGFGSITENLVNTTALQSSVKYAIDLANVNGCNSSHTVSVGVNPLPTVSFATDQSVCAGSSTKLVHFTGGFTGTSFAWTNNEPGIGLPATGTNDIASFVTTNSTGGGLMATIQVTPSLNGCNGNAVTVARISVNQPVSSNFIETYPAIACPNQAVGPLVSSSPLGGDGLNYIFQWQSSTDSLVFNNVPGIAATSRKSVAPAQTKDSWYRMTVSSGGCSSASLPVKILTGQKPTIAVTNRDNYQISKGNATQVFAEGALAYQWTPRTYVNDPIVASPFLSPIVDTRYTVTGINADGCSDTASVLIRVVDGYSIMPNNVLTPNGDGFNDLWKIKNIEYYKENSVIIYNSNSVKVFEKQNYTGDWNGTTTGGAKLASGVYYYVIKLKQGEVVVRGDLTLLN
jgi:gliding motility-associated-like protein